MDPVTIARDYLRDHVGHLTRPGEAAYDDTSRRWRVPIHCRTARGDVLVGDLILDDEGTVVSVPSRNELAARLAERSAPSTWQGSTVAGRYSS